MMKLNKDALWRREKFGFFIGREIVGEKIGDVPRYEFLNGTWLGRHFLTKSLYEYTADKFDPLTFITPFELHIQPDKHFPHDMGSVPAFAQILFPKDRFLASYLFHDSGYDHKGLWFRNVAGLSAAPSDWAFLPPAIFQADRDQFAFVPLARDCLDQMLRHWTGAQGALATERQAIYAAVRAGGGPDWKIA